MSKFKVKNSPMKVVGIVFLIITLIVAVSLTNNTVRKFVFNSFAFDYECAAKGSPGERNRCQMRNDDDRRAAKNAAKWNQYGNISVWLYEQYGQGRITDEQYRNIMNRWARTLRLEDE